MASSLPTSKDPKPASRKEKKNKRAPLPQNARIQKRPILHPPPPSPYTSAQSTKTIYLSARTPFMSAIKRCEKLLQLSERRLVQAATVAAKSGRWKDRDDTITAIADAAEKIKRKSEGGEEVVFKASGKAIGRGLEVGCWFQERGETYKVRLETGSVGVVDGIEYEDEEDKVDGDGEMVEEKEVEEHLPEARIRQISVLVVYVSLK